MRAFASAFVIGVAALGGCVGERTDQRTTLRLWGLGREGEVVQELVPEFERENPDLRVEVQQIPWSAAHEKLLTAFVGRSTPDLAQLGNTWISEFVALGALEPLNARVDASGDVTRDSFFPGIWDTNVIDGEAYGVPWYVDTKVLFYRKDLLAQAGYAEIPATWTEWRGAMEAVRRASGNEQYPVFLPVNEWHQPVIFGLQSGSTLLADHDTRGAFSSPEFLRAFRWYVDLFRDELAPPVGNNEIANVYQEFARGYIAMWITGPWNLGEFRNRLPEELADAWATAPLPGPEGGRGVSLAGGSSLVLFRASEKKDAAFRLVRWLSRPDIQLRFYRMTGDLPAHVAAWEDSALSGEPRIRAFRDQLERVVPTPKIPEWEQIATRVQERAELAIRGGASVEDAMRLLDADVDRILAKRRWLMERDGKLARETS